NRAFLFHVRGILDPSPALAALWPRRAQIVAIRPASSLLLRRRPRPCQSQGYSMSADEAQPARPAHADDPARAARRLMRTALKAALATLDRETGHPYASLILLATAP